MKLRVVEVEMVRKEIDLELELDDDVVEKINEIYQKEFLPYVGKELWRYPEKLTKDYLEAHFDYLLDESGYDFFPQFAFYRLELNHSDGPYLTTLEEFLRWTIRDIAEAYGWGESDERVVYTEGDPDPAVFLVKDDSEN